MNDGSAFEGLRELGIEIEKYEDDVLTNKVLIDQEADVIAMTKRNFIEELLQ